MTSVSRKLGLWLVIAAGGAASASSAQTAAPPARPAARPPAPAAAIVPTAPTTAPKYLADQFDSLAKAFSGRVGISVRSVDDGWSTGWRENELFPQQSVSKMWVAITALDAADKGRVNMSEKVSLSKGDLTLFHQPIASQILGGGYKASLDDLLFKAITTSDNTANDKLMRSVGGPSAVRAMIAAKRLGAIRFYDGERALQRALRGCHWKRRSEVRPLRSNATPSRRSSSATASSQPGAARGLTPPCALITRCQGTSWSSGSAASA